MPCYDINYLARTSMWPFNKIPEISVHDLKKLLESEQAPILLDVRTPLENQQGNIGGKLLPLGELPARIPELEPFRDREIVVYCRSGNRSGQAVQYLRSQGFEHVRNLHGGMLQWSREIDPSVLPD